MNFREALSERVILFDGAMGTEIYKRGVFINRSYDEVNLTAPDLVQDIHSAYVAASADVITTNTFGANRLRLVPFGLEDKHDEINAAGVRLAKAAAGDRALVAGSIGPTGSPNCALAASALSWARRFRLHVSWIGGWVGE